MGRKPESIYHSFYLDIYHVDPCDEQDYSNAMVEKPYNCHYISDTLWHDHGRFYKVSYYRSSSLPSLPLSFSPSLFLSFTHSPLHTFIFPPTIKIVGFNVNKFQVL